MRIKVCGLKHAENIGAVAALGPDYVGFICYAPSPRYASGLQDEILAALPEGIYKTAVFVNEDEEIITKLIDNYNFDAVQLHGNESPEFCELFRDKATVIKAFGIDEDFDFDRLVGYAGKVDYFLFDTKTPKHGGSGQSFDWRLLNGYKLNVPFFLSGGLSLDNLGEVKAIDHPQFFGVDLNSKFELEPGLKDIDKLKKAFEILK
ncbi:phosphoribosylanthranilate isomerase [Mucilaginibacter ginsenosidivorans]|uniref:N-(5'-phosphoribosyl)anthranilate isomerase n=1 Tax=Mucilaginibacter ginsenosidivorans TaxID=398053 RepID=A0A5B8UXS0_9SPHI|nr:phosphoribosylanthranilate isomerase [Mucilaginibacter ginsenosidivorans]QEC63834.1 phosphoribosylanthranilate isomerase [Mucilaginibacter ginsenosidivorans]